MNLTAIINKLMRNGWDCASAKNIGDWYFGEEPKDYNREKNKQDYLYLSSATWYLSDYVTAAEMYHYLQETYPECNETDKGYMQERLEKFAAMEKNAPEIDCDDERLHATLHRLRYIFNAINKPLRIYIASSEEDYNEFYARQFPNKDIFPYGSFIATCIYYDPKAYWIIFKRDFIDRLGDIELLGHCAHEMAHLDLQSKGIPALFKTFPELSSIKHVNNMMINERLTDLYVMSKGLAYCLYRIRLFCGASNTVLTADNIKEYILKLG